MNATVQRLHRLLAYFDNGAASIRSTLALLENDPTARGNGNGNGKPHNGHAMPAMVRDALGLDVIRRARLARLSAKINAPRDKPRRHYKAGDKDYGSAQARLKRRAVTGRLLAHFSTDTPTDARKLGPVAMRQLAVILRWGYVKRVKGGLFLRTAKPFVVDDRAVVNSKGAE